MLFVDLGCVLPFPFYFQYMWRFESHLNEHLKYSHLHYHFSRLGFGRIISFSMIRQQERQRQENANEARIYRFGEPKMIKSSYSRCSRWFHFDAKKIQSPLSRLLALPLLRFLHSSFTWAAFSSIPFFSKFFFLPVFFLFHWHFQAYFFCCGSILASYFHMIRFNGAYMNWMRRCHWKKKKKCWKILRFFDCQLVHLLQALR